jgi:hypothetical protein
MQGEATANDIFRKSKQNKYIYKKFQYQYALCARQAYGNYFKEP